MTLITVCLVVVLLLGANRYRDSSSRIRWVYLALAIVVMVFQIVTMMQQRIAAPFEWDFLVFWVAGKIAAQGLDFYDPAVYHQLPLPFTTGKEFHLEIIDAGVLYPPPTILLFAPLGFLEYSTAFVVWYGLHMCVLAGVALLLKRVYFPERNLVDWFVVLALIVLFQPVFETLYFGHFNFLLLLLFTLVWKDRDRQLVGLWVGAGILVKPFFGILLMWLLLRRRFAAVGVTLLTLGVLFAVAVLIFGPEICFSYFTRNPIGKEPDYIYFQSVNQSALAVMRRLFEDYQWDLSPLQFGPFLLFAAITTTITAWAILQANKLDWSLIATMALGLLIAPHSLFNYTVVMLPAIMFIWCSRGGPWAPIIFISIIYGLSVELSGIFYVNLLIWSVAVAACGWSTRRSLSTGRIKALFHNNRGY